MRLVIPVKSITDNKYIKETFVVTALTQVCHDHVHHSVLISLPLHQSSGNHLEHSSVTHLSVAVLNIVMLAKII